jgi:hypothetical protein
VGWKALKQLGIRPLANLAIYKLGLVTGHYTRASEKIAKTAFQENLSIRWPISNTQPKNNPFFTPSDNRTLVDEADRITKGECRLFGGSYSKILLSHNPPLQPWTEYERFTDQNIQKDIKFVWEPARFGWAISLARAWSIDHSSSYEKAFWHYWEEFQTSNPAFSGPNWMSGQETAIRLISVAFSLSIFKGGSEFTTERQHQLVRSIIEHAERIGLTLPYSRAQENNHYLIEGIGLYTAGWMLPDHSKSRAWRGMGWEICMDALARQISEDGTYCQHSMNYHRLMLQAALWFYHLAKQDKLSLPEIVLDRLRAGTGWYLNQIDAANGKAPNLGSNDGALLFPIGSAEFADHRPTAQAASSAFLGGRSFTSGAWDELCLWLGLETSTENQRVPESDTKRAINKLGNDTCWATLRAVNYHQRPNHADQLHVDLWCKGNNLLLDAGSFQYNALPPWDNALASTRVHNTVTVDDQDQMTRAGRFLWLDWAQARVINRTDRMITAEHTGYGKLGVLHRRTLERVSELEWKVIDELLPTKSTSKHLYRIYWLVADGSYKVDGNNLDVSYPQMKLRITLSTNTGSNEIQLIRAGDSKTGKTSDLVNFGWYSPTYGEKIPALSLRMSAESSNTVQFITLVHIDDSKSQNGSSR